MSLVPVPGWTAVPPFPLLSDRRLGTYNSKAFAFANHLSTVFMQELGVLMESVYQNALWAQDRATFAQQQAVIADTQAGLAMGYRNVAGNYATQAGQSKDTAVNAAATATQQATLADTARQLTEQARETTYQYRQDALGANEAAGLAKQAAQAARDQAQVFATQQLKASSASNLTPASGNKAFAVEPSRSFVQGMYLVATSTGAPANWMSGYVVSYDMATGALVIAVDAFAGAAARSDWVIGVAVLASINLQSLNRGAALREVNNGTLVANKRYGIWTGGGAIAMTMPTLANCANGDEIVLGNLQMTWGATAFTINCPANVVFKTPMGANDSQLVCDTNAVQGITLYCVWNDGAQATWAIL